jgi:malate dehydrogenase (oxaloacetate-decarboxylating)(NADP+)
MKDRIIISGAGSAGVGIADAIVTGLVNEGIDKREAEKLFYVLNSKGLLGTGSGSFTAQQKPYVREDLPTGMSLLEVVKAVKPTMLIGVSGVPAIFNEEIVKICAAACDRPVIMPLSNPTIMAECTLEQVMDWTDGRGIFAAGSPFADVTRTFPDGRTVTLKGNQCNNMYVFPSLGLAASKCHAKVVSDGMLYRASMSLAEQVSDEDVKKGILFPPLSKIRQLSQKMAADVVLQAVKEGLVAKLPVGATYDEVYAWIGKEMYHPEKFF